jgi:two-component system cell cycle sensor histidine kinase/response regulator CckA
MRRPPPPPSRPPRARRVSAASAAPASTLRFTQFAVDNLSDAAYWIERDARITYVNDAACRLTGYDRGELLRMRVYDLNPDISEETWPEVWASLKRTGKRTFEARHQGKDGRMIPVEISANFLRFRGREYSCAFARDITERRQLEMRLRQAEKMEGLGQLAGGIAHDFNNQLMGIMGYAEVLNRRLVGQPELGLLAGNIRESVRRAGELTTQLLAFSRTGMRQSQRVDVHRLVADVINILHHSIDKNIRIDHRLEAECPYVLGDSTQLQSAVLNLALNARDAMPEGGTLTLASANVHLDEGLHPDQLFSAPPGEYVRLTVSDTGVGMDPETRRRAFEPFFTTKPSGKGTGLGLAAVYGTIRGHGGTIGIRSSPGAGTAVEVCLPATIVAPADAELESAEPRSRLRSLHVVLVEDEPVLREVTKKMLEDLGCRVTTFGSGMEAVHFYSDRSATVDVVILDMVMPVMNGRETFLAMRAVNPRVRALLASGYSLEGEARAALECGARGFVQKPYDSATLARKIVEVLDQE